MMAIGALTHMSGAVKRHNVVLHRRAEIALDSLTEKERAAVIVAIEHLSSGDWFGDLIRQGSSHEDALYKRRAGRTLRILFSMPSTGELLIQDILHRGSLDYIRLLASA